MKKNLDNYQVENINVVRDIPISDINKLEISFGYDIYAQKLSQIIRNNSGPLSIGLLGPWGYGKSTILEIFKKEIEKDLNFRVIYFNSWKYSNDSFRRQFLIEFATIAYEGKKLFEKINNFNTRFLKDLEKGIKIETNKYFYFLLVIFIILIILGKYIPRESNWILQSVGLFSFMGIFLKVLSEKLFNNFIKLDIDPKITFPEHFESEFREMKDNCKNRKLIFIIDDIDRCRPEIVLEILDSSKTFLAINNSQETYNNIYFIFAMDDFAVRSILTKYRNKNYEIEDVVKFFDVIIRINPINTNDLLEYAKSLIKELKLNEKILDIIFYADFDTPRKIKHFINSYNVTLAIARERKRANLFNIEEKDLELIIAKMLVIQMMYPEFLHDIGNKIPYIIKNFELNNSFNKEELEKYNIFLNQDSIPKLSKVSTFIAKTRYLSPIIDFESFINLKIPRYAINFGLEYSVLKNSILNFDEETLEEITILKQIDKKNGIKNSIIEMFKSLIDDSFYPPYVKKNIFKSLIFINKKINLEDDLDFINFVVENAKIQNIPDFLELEPEVLFRWCEKTNQNKNNLIDKFLAVDYSDLDELKKKNFISLIDLIYKDAKLLDKYAENINSKIKKMNKEVQIEILSNITTPKQFNDYKEKIPGEDVLNLLLESNKQYVFNKEFLDIFFKFWYPGFNLKITELILNKITMVQNISDKEVDNIFYAIVKIYEIDKVLNLKTTITQQQIDQIITFFKQNKNRESEKLIKALIIISKSLNLNVSVLKEFIFSLNEDMFKYLLEFLYENKNDNKLNKYYESILQDIFSFMIFNGKNLTQKYFLGLPEIVLNGEENKIKNFINNIFSEGNLYLKNIDYLMFIPKIIKKIGSIEKYKKEVLNKILIAIKLNNNFDFNTKKELIKVYIDIVKNNFRFEDKEFADIILSYLKSGNPNYIQLGLSYIIEMKKGYEKSSIDFKVIVAEMLKYIPQINNFIPEIKNILIKLLDFKDDFDRENSELLVKTLDSFRIKNQYGLLIEIIEKLEKSHTELIPEEWDKFKQSVKLINDNNLKIKIDNIISQKGL